jgi:hypothetical protein
MSRWEGRGGEAGQLTDFAAADNDAGERGGAAPPPSIGPRVTTLL